MFVLFILPCKVANIYSSNQKIAENDNNFKIYIKIPTIFNKNKLMQSISNACSKKLSVPELQVHGACVNEIWTS